MSVPESEPGAGTPFEILLQRANETAGPDSTHVHAPGTLLLVENDVFLRATYRDLLVGAGWQVLAAHDGFNALLQANAHRGRIDLLICDVILPQMSGIELWRRLSRLRPEATVLFISGDLERARKLFADGEDPPRLLAKPFTPATLLETVRVLLAESPFLRQEPPAQP